MHPYLSFRPAANLFKQKSPAYSPTWCRFTNFVHKKRQNKNNKIEKKEKKRNYNHKEKQKRLR